MTDIAYKYNIYTKEYTGKEVLDAVNPAWPPNSTDIAPPEGMGPHMMAVFNEQTKQWVPTADWRGVALYNKTNGQPLPSIQALGITPDSLNATDILPPTLSENQIAVFKNNQWGVEETPVPITDQDVAYLRAARENTAQAVSVINSPHTHVSINGWPFIATHSNGIHHITQPEEGVHYDVKKIITDALEETIPGQE